MDLNTLWFILVSVLFAGFFFLEGFDYGAGAMLPLLGKSDKERRLIINSFGPIWDGNEVWLLTAGGAIFAAFPHWYATLFSGFYLALFLILLALILRIAAIEFRSKKEDPVWQKRWDIALTIGSAAPAFLFGVAVSNFVTGVPIAANMQYAGTLWNLLGPHDLLGGLVFLALFCYHGCLFINLKTDSPVLKERVEKYAPRLFFAMLAMLVVWLVCMFILSDMFKSVPALILTLLAAVALVFSILTFLKKRPGLAFIGTGAGIVLFTFAVFAGMFPNVMISTLDPAYSLTIYTASSSAYTLKLMSIVAACLVPIVLAYQAWTYWVFRKRITEKDLEQMHY
ncbi:MAG: cytochrome d ubiquinol oxidase subunit II [Clostridiales bacterium]|jgi:cytochrome d ubiquinol oxidase subunit II|nr:cytochrome d ubiquinol oxidase subunit II [Clostridiales bacterium]MDR2713488.1 cytochrome d ubiquinol oxidase subunit II [Clostridiales bacterium]